MSQVMIAHASKDENGGLKNGRAGDQTGQEVTIRSWYKRPWNVVLRPKSSATANKIADAMEKAAKNDHIGYDQNQRNSLLTEARKVGYDPGRVTKDVETDCSALVSLACMYAGIPESVLFIGGNSSTTATLRRRLMGTGQFIEFTAPNFVNSQASLERGDILLYEGHHVAVVVQATANNKSVREIALRIIRKNDLGQGRERENKLREMGYDPSEVQAEINRILKGG